MHTVITRTVAGICVTITTVLVSLLSAGTARAAIYEATFTGPGAVGWSANANAGSSIDGWTLATTAGWNSDVDAAIEFASDVSTLRISSANVTVALQAASATVTGRLDYRDGPTWARAAVVGANGTHVLDLDRAADRIAVGLHVAGSSGGAVSTLRLIDAVLQLDDQRAPTIEAATAAADPNGGCTRIRVAASDAESGIASATIRDRRTLAVLATWAGTRQAGIHPGAPAIAWEPCVAHALLSSGTRYLDVDVEDVAGQHTHAAMGDTPMTAANAGGGSIVITSPTSLHGTGTFTLRGSLNPGGSAQPGSWQLLVDGQRVPMTGDASSATATVGPLAPGTHQLTLSARTASGSTVTSSSTYVVDAVRGLTKPQVAALARAVATGSNAERIVLVHAAPAQVVVGTHLAIAAMVVRAGRVVPRRVVHLRGANGAVLASSATNSDGIAILRAVVRANGLAVVVPNAPVRLPLRTVVAPRISIRTSAVVAALGSVATVRGAMTPARACRTLTLRARRGAGWFVVRDRITCDATGHFSVSVTANARGRFQLRIHSAALRGWAAGVSRIAPLHVR